MVGLADTTGVEVRDLLSGTMLLREQMSVFRIQS
jgi:hypothetical protein